MAQNPNRRTALKVAGATALSITSVSGCLGTNSGSSGSQNSSGSSSRSGDQLADTLHFVGGGGDWNKAWEKHVNSPFKEEYGVDIKMSSTDEESVVGKLRAGTEGSLDIVSSNGLDTYRLVDLDLIQSIDPDKLDNWSNLRSVVKDLPQDPGSVVHGVPNHFGTIGIAVNTDEINISGSPSLKELWNSKYKGNMILRDSASRRVYNTALYLGKDIHNLKQKDMDSIFDAMSEQRPYAATYFSSGTALINAFAKGEVTIGEAWGGRIQTLQEDGHKEVIYTLPKEGALTWVSTLNIPKSSKKKDTVLEFLDFALKSEIQEKLCPDLGYPSASTAVTKEMKKLPDFVPIGKEKNRLKFQDYKFTSKNIQDWENKFKKIKLK